jgi:type IV pilus biogenesis protein CpaD/CtpE
MKNILRTILIALLLAAATGLLSSCATDDPSNIDTKPWNLPQDWEGPFPSNMNQGR